MGAEQIQQLRRLVPVRLVPSLVKRRLDRIWGDPDYRQSVERQMEFLFGRTERASEIPELAYRHAEHSMMRSYLRWHPRAITRQPVRGIEWLTSRRDPDRGVVLSFAHHNHYDGMFGSVARHGVKLHIVMTPEIMGGKGGIAFQQHERVVSRGGQIVPSNLGTEPLAALLGPGTTLAIASDFPGRTPVTFLGRRVLGSFGAARIAMMTESPVVVVTARRDGSGSYLQLDEPIDPKDVPDAGDLLDEILRRHGEAFLAWPEAVEAPTARFGAIAE